MPSTRPLYLFFIVSMVHRAHVQAAHPLVTEDAGVQGSTQSQIEINTDQSRRAQSSQQIAVLTYAYGLTPVLDGFINLPAASPVQADFRQLAMGEVCIGSKYVFAQNAEQSWAGKVEWFFPTTREQRAQ